MEDERFGGQENVVDLQPDDSLFDQPERRRA